MENKSYDLQFKNMQSNRSRIPMECTNLQLKNNQRQFLAVSTKQSPGGGYIDANPEHDSITKTGMLSDYFAKSDAKLETQN